MACLAACAKSTPSRRIILIASLLKTSDAGRDRRHGEEITLSHVQRARLSRYARWCPGPATVLTAIAWRLLLLRVSGPITFALQGPD